jgi:beta-N-acetylhexosaminidase
LSGAERDFFRAVQPWGFILFSRNVESPAQLRALTAELRGAVDHDAPIFIDQEGGRVARLRPPDWRDWLPPLDQVNHNKRHAARAMYLRYRLIADELRAVGIDGNCAPVLDIAQPDTHPILRNRCYGDDVVHVAEIAGAVASALVDGGVLPVVKHIPGHGRATADSHEALPHVRQKLGSLKITDFLAFEAVASLPLAMTAHVVYDAIDPDNPATTSPEVIAMVRETIGFGGVLMTDDISMGALSGPVNARARAALGAGCDMVLHCNGDMGEMRAVAEAAGALSDASARRAEAALGWRRAPDTIDIAALEAEFHDLMTGRA